jgi:putative copper export protein
MLSGVWAGIAFGRTVLAYFLNKRLGERTFAIVLLSLASAMLAVLYVQIWAVDAGTSSLTPVSSHSPVLRDEADAW